MRKSRFFARVPYSQRSRLRSRLRCAQPLAAHVRSRLRIQAQPAAHISAAALILMCAACAARLRTKCSRLRRGAQPATREAAHMRDSCVGAPRATVGATHMVVHETHVSGPGTSPERIPNTTPTRWRANAHEKWRFLLFSGTYAPTLRRSRAIRNHLIRPGSD